RYEAEDSKGNLATKDRMIVVTMDTINPTISLLGLLVDTLNYLDTYTEAGSNADDTCAGINNVDVHGAVNTSVLGDYELDEDKYVISDNYDKNLTLTKTNDGTYYSDYLKNKYWGFYTIIYNTADNSGNKADEVVRFVNVQECSWKGIAEGLDQYISMYPNPTKGEFVVVVDLPQSENIVIKVTNMLGEEIEFISQPNSKGGVFSIDLANFANGVYFVQLQTDNASTVKKVTLAK
ncbi:T9SS type A sorting domain-containing protein, partial [Bacteroidota bacterium]